MKKFIRFIGITFLCLPLPIILGTAGSSDLAIISSKQAMLRCGIAILIGMIGVIFIYITDHMSNSKSNNNTNINSNIYNKCCYCENYKTCTKSYNEVVNCK